MIESRPFLLCQNPECSEKHIALPYQSLREISPNLSEWPKGEWRKNLAHSRCGHVYLYTELHVRRVQHMLAQSLQIVGETDPAICVQCVEIKCGEPGCGLPVRIHIIPEGGILTKQVLDQTVASWKFQIDCPNGHPIEAKKILSVVDCYEDWRL